MTLYYRLNNAANGRKTEALLWASGTMSVLVYFWLGSLIPYSYRAEPVAIAKNLVTRGFCGKSFAVDSGATAVVPPLFPAFLASIRIVVSSEAMCFFTCALITTLVYGLHVDPGLLGYDMIFIPRKDLAD